MIWSSWGQAYFIDTAHGVRPAGMGEAFVSVADDANTVLFNPAGFAQIQKIELASMYSDLYSSLDVRLYNQAQDHFGYNFLSLAFPLEAMQGSLGVSWMNFSTVFYQENVVTLSGGTQALRSLTAPLGFQLDAGISFKYLQWGVDGSEYLASLPTSNRGRYGLTMDAGLLAEVYTKVKIGAAIDNIIPADTGLLIKEYVPSVYRLGASYTYDLDGNAEYLNSLLATAEVSLRDKIYVPKAGVESWWFNDLVGIRTGVNTEQFTAGISVNFAWPATPLALRADYAFSYPFYIADTLGSHRVGMMVDWDITSPPPTPAPTPVIAGINRAVSLAQEAAASAQAALLDLQTAVAQGPAVAAAIANSCLAQAEDAEQIAGLAARVALPDAEDTTPTAQMLALSDEAKTAWNTAQQAQEEIRRIIAGLPQVPPVAAGFATARPQAVPERYPDKIVIGVEKRIIEDYGGMRDAEPFIRLLGDYLKTATRYVLEWKLLSPAELQLAFRQGELDFVAAYETDLQPYIQARQIKPAATIRSHGQQSQAACLLVRAGDSIATPGDLLGKRLGYSSPEIIPHLQSMFYPSHPGFQPGNFFGELKKQRNARDSLWALQMEAVDAIVEYEYITDVAARPPNIQARVIARSQPKANARIYQRVSQLQTKRAAQKALLEALGRFHQARGAETFMGYFGIEQFVPANGD